MVKVDFDIDGETSDSRKRGRGNGKHTVKFPTAIATLPKSPREPIGGHDVACEAWRSCRVVELSSCRVVELSSCRVVELSSCRVVELSSCRAVAAERGRFEIGPRINQDRRRGEWVSAGQVSYLLVNLPKLVDSKVRFGSEVSASLLAKQDRRLSTGLSKLC
jgi:hypothetical protein